MGLYTKNNLLNGYKRNHKERAALDYYATPTKEVTNILNQLDFIDYNQVNTILEPCCGEGHMIKGVQQFFKEKNLKCKIIGTDFMDRGYQDERVNLTYNLDFLDDNYPIDKADMIIMNPPYSTLEPFFIRALEIAEKYLIVLCRTEALEGQGRFKNVYSENPISHIYQYVDRIQCLKNGQEQKGSSAQAYAWFVWDKTKNKPECTLFHHIRRIND